MVLGSGSRSRSNSMSSSNPPQSMSYAQRYFATQQQQPTYHSQQTYQSSPQHLPPSQPRYQPTPPQHYYYPPQPPSPNMMAVDMPEDPRAPQYPYYPPPPSHYGQAPSSPGFQNRSFANPAGGLTGSPTTQSYPIFHPPPPSLPQPPSQHHQPPPSQYSHSQPRTYGGRPLSMNIGNPEFGNGGGLQRRYSNSANPPIPPSSNVPGPTEAEAKARRYRKKTPPECCHVCSATETPEWRKGPSGPRTTCNACGLVHSKMNLSEPKDLDEVLRQLEMVGCSRFRTSKHTLPPGARERCARTWIPPSRGSASSRFGNRQSAYSQVERDAAAQLAALPHTRPIRSNSLSTAPQTSASGGSGTMQGSVGAGLTYQPRAQSPNPSGSAPRWSISGNNRAASPVRRWGSGSNASSTSSHGGSVTATTGNVPFPALTENGYRTSSPDMMMGQAKRLSQVSLEDEGSGEGNIQSNNSRMSIASLTNPTNNSQRERKLSTSELATARYKEELEKRRKSKVM